MSRDPLANVAAYTAAARCEPLADQVRSMGIDPETWLALTPLGRLRAELAALGPKAVTP